MVARSRITRPSLPSWPRACDAMNATDNHCCPRARVERRDGDCHRSALVSSQSCRSSVATRIESPMQADITGRRAASASRTSAALTGDDVTAGDEPEARRVFDLDGPQLVRLANSLKEGRYLSGRKIDPAHQ